MGRAAKFTEDQILDAALALAAEMGAAAVTMAAIAARAGAPTGSLYHRFGSRDLLIATLWLRTVRRFQRGFVAALEAGDAEAAALHTLRWSREHLDEATILLLHRRADLAAQWPAELGEALTTVNTEAAAAMDTYLGAHPETDRDRLIYAVVDAPYAAARRHLLHRRPPPPEADALVIATCRAILPGPTMRG